MQSLSHYNVRKQSTSKCMRKEKQKQAPPHGGLCSKKGIIDPFSAELKRSEIWHMNTAFLRHSFPSESLQAF